MSYYKRVVYMDCYENGEKVSNGGFVKLLKLKKEEGTFARKPEEPGRERLCLQIQALNLPWRDDLWGNVKLLADEREILLGNIKLNGGRGMLQIKDLEEFLRKNGVKDAGEICEKPGGWGLKVVLTPDCELWCRLGMQQEESKETAEDDKRMPDVMSERRESDEAVERDAEGGPEIREMKSSQDEWKIEKKINEHDMRKDSIENAVKNESNMQEMKNSPGDHETENSPGEQENKNESGTKENHKEPDEQELRNRPVQMPKKMQRDKWKQLWEIFPHICPFQDEREYLQLDLRDLLVLAGRYYRLVENSFLLHGYYNYEHLVLMRTYRRGAEKYYLGVPGNYYEREKQVAVWFGFESFETGSEPAAEGDFGSYMISVDM